MEVQAGKPSFATRHESGTGITSPLPRLHHAPVADLVNHGAAAGNEGGAEEHAVLLGMQQLMARAVAKVNF